MLMQKKEIFLPQKDPDNLSGVFTCSSDGILLESYPEDTNFFSHPDYTVGTGILFKSHRFSRFSAGRGLYRRLGLAPDPEDFSFSRYTITLLPCNFKIFPLFLSFLDYCSDVSRYPDIRKLRYREDLHHFSSLSSHFFTELFIIHSNLDHTFYTSHLYTIIVLKKNTFS